MNVVCVRKLPPVGPLSEPIDCNKRQAIAPSFGQLSSEPAGTAFFFCAHTLLLSKELCQVTLPKGNGFGAIPLGCVSRLQTPNSARRIQHLSMCGNAVAIEDEWKC